MAVGAQDEGFEHAGYRVQWSGWRPLPNQAVTVGWWWAVRLPVETARTFAYASTCGAVHVEVPEFNTLDMTCVPGWPRPFEVEMMRPAQREALKARTKQALLDRLDQP